ncbi:MurR/RpiR family transcriptional regulator [Sinosporangium siamense]|uniref:RpiR family transcriptional regulator n=1 Tax=Sinosporangium siamense TaxID=1367973 RepID=A0A919RM63_9ACTN|nr:MurR/RpiR family transcriptional regulator [Sinosporangium siamense]GII94979.1 RpiR family transcriptional regulator [Sinosporangium siamense]
MVTTPEPSGAVPSPADGAPSPANAAGTSPEPRTVAAQLRDILPKLPKAEQRVARALLAGYPTAGLEPLATVAGLAQTSPATVLRLAYRLGFEGYPELQQTLKRETQQRYSSPIAQYGEAPALDGGVIARSRAVLLNATAQTFDQLPEGELLKAAALIADPTRRISAAGGRFSGMLAQYLVAHLHQLRPGTAHIPGSSADHAAYLLDAGRRDVLVVFDYRRYQRETITFAREASARNAKIILFTDPWLSPAAAVADVVLPAQVTSPSPFDSLTPALAVIEALIAAVVEELGEAGRERVAEYDQLADDVLREDGDLFPSAVGKQVK